MPENKAILIKLEERAEEIFLLASTHLKLWQQSSSGTRLTETMKRKEGLVEYSEKMQQEISGNSRKFFILIWKIQYFSPLKLTFYTV